MLDIDRNRDSSMKIIIAKKEKEKLFKKDFQSIDQKTIIQFQSKAVYFILIGNRDNIH